MSGRFTALLATLALFAFAASSAFGDGGVRPPRVRMHDRFVEKAQEAIIVFHEGEKPGEAVEDMVLKIGVSGGVPSFAWVIPFPTEPAVEPAPNGMFRELHGYVSRRWNRPAVVVQTNRSYGGGGSRPGPRPVEVLSRRAVGRYDVATVREHEPGALNQWLGKNGYASFEGGDDVLEFYRKKGYVFVCLKVREATGTAGKTTTLHPLRFTFKTGGRDGIYFPMKLTGLQHAPFAVNLYVFYRAWLNHQDNWYGFRKRGFYLRFRDFDSHRCEKGAGKLWSDPAKDKYLAPDADGLTRVAAYFRKHHPGKRYYLTNLGIGRLDPRKVRKWTNDLWLFPMYDERGFVPYDARPGGPAVLPDEDNEEGLKN